MKVALLGTLIAAMCLCVAASASGEASVGNGMVAFVDNQRVWAIDTTSGTVAVLADDSGGALSWSPDGTRLLYTHFGRPTPKPAAYTMNPDGTDKRLVAEEPNGAVQGLCWFSRDLVVVRISPIDGMADLYATRPDGADLRRLTLDGSAFKFGSCAPPANRIFYSDYDRGINEPLAHYYVSPSGGTPVRLPLTGGTIYPSPDGTKLAWLDASEHIVMTDVDGRNPVLVSQSRAPPPLIWSPDSEHLALTASAQVHEVDVHSKDERALTAGIGDYPAVLAWSPDGMRILYANVADRVVRV